MTHKSCFGKESRSAAVSTEGGEAQKCHPGTVEIVADEGIRVANSVEH